MKNNFFLTFFILAIVYISRNSVSGQDLRAKATEVLNEANALNKKLGVFKNIQQVAKADVTSTTLSNIRIGATDTPQVTELNKKLEELKSKNGIAQCLKIRNDGITKIVNELNPPYRSAADQRLDAQLGATNSALQNLATIINNLQGNQLENNIKACQSNPSQCVITGSYPQQITQFTNTMNENKKILFTQFDDLYKQLIAKQIPSKVLSEVYNPTMQCIKNIGGA